MFGSAARAFSELPRWMFIGVLFYAPLAYGAVRDWARERLILLLGVVLALWVIGLTLRWTLPRIPKLLMASCLGILVLGWGMTLNPQFAYDGIQHIFIPVKPPAPWAPGTVEAILSLRAMSLISALLGTVLFVCDTASDPRWLRRIWGGLCLAGLVLISFGLYHRATGWPTWLWEHPRFEFATYRYHPNAGAFINIVVGTTLGMIVLVYERGGKWWIRFWWVLILPVMVAGGLVNASKAAQGILAFLLIAAAAWRLPVWWRCRSSIRWNLALPGGILAAALLAGAVYFVGWDMAERRWKQMLAPGWSNERRIGAYEVGLQMAEEAGWFGFGPGTFQPVFPHYTLSQGDRLAGIWRELHMDYLQTAIEFGWLGAGLWSVIMGGAIVRCLLILCRVRRSSDREERALSGLAGGALLALGGVGLHALIDFPLQIPSLQLYALTVIGCVWALRRPTRPAGAGQASDSLGLGE